ncbi:MAG TPA: beta-ketoacyl-ACP synthase III [Anaeromyxobacteraceae bacterium]|nr:beta-ketoacyl-ACP synthase III [Anaeromyxobacteraceae bacterium]
MPRAAFAAIGTYVPDRVVTNEELTRYMDTSDEWIRQRTGIEERRWVEPGSGMGSSEMGYRAALRALDQAGWKAGEVEAIVFATLSSDHMFPGDGCFLNAKLGIPGVPALDIRNQCSGFLYGLSVADAWIRGGVYRKVLLVGAETHSTGLDVSTRGRDVSVIFGDGAAAVLLEATDDPDRGVLAVELHADGRFAKDLWTDAPGSVYSPRISREMAESEAVFPHMEGQKVFKHAIVRMPEAVKSVLARTGLRTEDIKVLVPHQANLRIAEMVQRSLGLRDDQVFNNIQKYGNTTAASIPLALSEAVAARGVKRGDLVAMAAFGAGFTWGAALARW